MVKGIKMVISVITMGMAICLLNGCMKSEEPKTVDSQEEKGLEDLEAQREADSTGGVESDWQPDCQPAEEDIEPEPDYLTCTSGTIVAEELTEEEIADLFCAQEIPEEVFARMDGVSYVENDDISLEDLRYLRLLYVGFDEETHVGELVVHVSIADSILEIFQILYENNYQIEKMRLIDDYGGDDHASLLDNNTSAFNYRVVEGSEKLSRHAYGLAIDINPFYNPYVTYPGGEEHISPEGSEPYADRDADFPHKIGKDGDLCWQLFEERGFTWGGDWKSLKDYQHFQISQ